MDSRSQKPTAAVKKLALTPMLTLEGHKMTPILTLEGHKHTIPSISYFPDSKRMISGSYDMTTRKWDLEAGKETEDARVICAQEVNAVGVSRDGRWVVTAFGELKVCEVETGTVRTFEGHLQRIDRIDISGDSTLLAGAEGSTVRIWNLETGELVAGSWFGSEEVGAVRFLHDSKKLAIKGCDLNYLEVWGIQTPRSNVKVQASRSLAISSTPVFWTTKDKTIVAAFSSHGSQNMIYELHASTLDPVGAPFEEHTKIITGLALSLDCTLLASASDDVIKLRAYESRQFLASFDVAYAHHLILSPDSRHLVYTTLLNKIYLCNIPPEIFATTQLLPQISAPRSLLLADSGALSLTANQSTGAIEAPPNAQRNLPSNSLPPPPISFAHRRARSKSWTDRHARSSRIEPTNTRPLMRQWPTVLPPPQTPSTIGSWLSQLRPDPRKLLPSSSHTHTVSSARDVEPDDLSPEATLQDLSKYITKDGDYPVARGGFGEIWKCTIHIDRSPVKVAVKALQVYADDQLGAAKTKKTKRIKRELRICANLKHPNILPVYGYTSGFGPFIAIVSPWAEKGNLTAYLEREHVTLTLLRRFEILKDVIAGLRYLHANSVIHGDFNGPNVLIHGDGTACVADFGLSLMYSEVISASQASWTSTLKGNMRWMAPELLVEQDDGSQVRPSEQSDIYSFGGIMLQVLTNKVPYYHLANDAAIVLCIAKSQTPSRSRYPELPEQYWQFIEQCWSTDPRDRPSTEGADMTISNEFYSLSRPRFLHCLAFTNLFTAQPDR